MSEERERTEDEDLQELKRRRSRRDDEDSDEKPRGRGRKGQPTIEKFQIWFDFNKSTVTADYVAPEGYTADDLDRFVNDLMDDGFRLYKKQAFEKKRGNYDNRRDSGRSGGRYEN